MVDGRQEEQGSTLGRAGRLPGAELRGKAGLRVGCMGVHEGAPIISWGALGSQSTLELCSFEKVTHLL